MKGVQRWCLITFAELVTTGVEQQGDVVVVGRGDVERALQGNLPSSGVE